MSSKFGQIKSGTTELAALEHLKLMLPLFLVSQLWLYMGNIQVSVYRTIGPLIGFVVPRLHTYVYCIRRQCMWCLLSAESINKCICSVAVETIVCCYCAAENRNPRLTATGYGISPVLCLSVTLFLSLSLSLSLSLTFHHANKLLQFRCLRTALLYMHVSEQGFTGFISFFTFFAQNINCKYPFELPQYAHTNCVFSFNIEKL